MRTVSSACLCASMLFSVPCFGVLIATENFEAYTPGSPIHNLNGGTGFTGNWTVDGPRQPEVTAVSAGLSYINGDIAVNGGGVALQYSATEDGISQMISRELPAIAGPVYLSFLYNNSVDVGPGSGNDFIQMGFETSGLSNPLFSAMDRNTSFQIRSTTSAGNSVNTGIASTAGQTFFIVLKADKTGASSTYNEITMWVDPSAATEAGNPFSAQSTVDSGLDLSGAAFLNIRKAFQEAGDTYLIDNLSIGTEFADVISLVAPPVGAVPEPSTLVQGLTVMLGISLVRRRRAKKGVACNK